MLAPTSDSCAFSGVDFYFHFWYRFWSASGLRRNGYALCRQPLTIADRFNTLDYYSYERILVFLLSKLIIWQVWCIHFGTLGDHGTIQGHEKANFGIGPWIFLDSRLISVSILRAYPDLY